MIEINLVPDVKQQLLRAQNIRLRVITFSIIASLVAVGIVVLLSMLYGVEAVRGTLLDRNIADNSKKLSSVEDINKTLTLQNQLTHIQQIHDASHVNSRIFGVLVPVSGQGTPNQVQYSTVTINNADSIVTVQAQTAQYSGVDAFQKTLQATKFQYTTEGSSQANTVDLATDVHVSNQSLGQSATGSQVVSFTLSFKYPAELLAPTSKNARVITPSSSNATDSYQGIPKSLFTGKAEGAQ